jgi:hypothetical protein
MVSDMFVWECINCGYRVATAFDLHINDRPTCVECNAEMEPQEIGGEAKEFWEMV